MQIFIVRSTQPSLAARSQPAASVVPRPTQLMQAAANGVLGPSLPAPQRQGPSGKARSVLVRFREDDAKTRDATPADTRRVAGDGATTHLVPVVLKYGKRCNFGEHFAVVGSVPELGSWDPTKAVTMKWTPGDVWTAVLRLPVNTEVQYKYIRRSDKGHVVAWEGSEQGAGGMGNLSLTVTPGQRFIHGHGVEVHHTLPSEYADIAGWSLTGSSPITTVTGATAGPAFTGTTGYTGAPGTTTATTGSGTVGSGTLSGVVGAARDKLAALESKIPFIGHRGEHTPTADDYPDTATTPTGGIGDALATGSTPPTTGATSTATTGTASTGTTTVPTGSPTYPTGPMPTTNTTTGTAVDPFTPTAPTAGAYPSSAPAPAGTNIHYPPTANTGSNTFTGTQPPDLTVGDVAAAANAPGTVPGAHVAPAQADVHVVGAEAISSADLASSLIAAGPAAAALSAATVGLPADEAGNIPLVVTPPGGHDTAPPPPLTTMSGASATLEDFAATPPDAPSPVASPASAAGGPAYGAAAGDAATSPAAAPGSPDTSGNGTGGGFSSFFKRGSRRGGSSS